MLVTEPKEQDVANQYCTAGFAETSHAAHRQFILCRLVQACSFNQGFCV